MSLGQNHIGAAQLRPYLEKCDYHDALLASNLELTNGRTLPLAAFSQPVHDSRSACIAVLDATNTPEADVAACRSAGAPLVFVSSDDCVQFWQQGVTNPQLLVRIPVGQLPQFFEQERTRLSPQAVYRAKTWARFDSSYQLPFVALGLMPLVEEEIGRELTSLIERVIDRVKQTMGWQEISLDKGLWLLKTNFWLLAAKILKDKQVNAFAGLELENLTDVFARLAKHYGASAPISIEGTKQTKALREAARDISQFSNLELVSTEALAYIYENAFITKETRDELGTHSTPAYLVDYIVGKLRPWIEKIPAQQRTVFEPACGHAAFLLSAMRLLSELPPMDTATSKARHNYLQNQLHGVEIDAFAFEIARLSLTLADAPNANGWNLQNADVFADNTLAQRAREANIILANPPFGPFSDSQRASLKAAHNRPPFITKAAEIIWQVVNNMQPGAVFGAVLPQTLLDSKKVTPLRRYLLENFEISEICLLPADKIFSKSGAASAVILGRRLAKGKSYSGRVSFKRIHKDGIEIFKSSYQTSKSDEVDYSDFSTSPNSRLYAPELHEIWDGYCQSFPRLSQFAHIGQGFQFRSKKNLKGAITESKVRIDGLSEGFAHPGEETHTHERPKTAWFNLSLDVISIERSGTSQGVSQLLLGYARASREAWRLKAFIDKKGLPFTSNFLVVRPKNGLPLEAAWGLCNSPFANAYAYDYSTKKVNTDGLMSGMPLPQCCQEDFTSLITAVRRYFDAASSYNQSLQAPTEFEKLKELHWRIDAEVLRLYGLPRELEFKLLKFFSGVRRRGVPFEQTEYFPEEFTDPITLSELLAITYDWEETNERRADLIVKKVERRISPGEKAELDNLQRLATARRHLLAPLPLKELEDLREELIQKGVWVGK